MSIQADVPSSARWHIGEDKLLRVTVYTDATLTTCVDVTGFALSWKLAPSPDATALITKTTSLGITIAGLFNADPATNNQVITIAVDDLDTQPIAGALAARTYYHELKRTDTNVEAVLLQGRVSLLPSLHPS
jgi:hypothetical protein